MTECMDLKWFILPPEENGKMAPWSEAVAIVTEDCGPTEIICWITRGHKDPQQLAQHICDAHNEWLEQRWDNEAYLHAVEKDD